MNPEDHPWAMNRSRTLILRRRVSDKMQKDNRIRITGITAKTFASLMEKVAAQVSKPGPEPLL